MSDDAVPSNEKVWQELDTPTLTTTLLDGAGDVIPLANINTLTITQWVETGPPGRPGTVAKSINSRNAQDALNTHQVTVNATSGLVTWSLVQADTTFQSRDTTVLEERHWFQFVLTFTASATVFKKSYVDYYDIMRKRAVVT